MTTTPTQRPVPSEMPQDTKFNAGKIDQFVTSNNHDYVDRLGGKHRTIAGINYDANQAILNYGYITKDSFEDGGTIGVANECLRWKSNGEYYRWDGAFPKVVPPGSTPDSAGGIGKGKWVGVVDASLRSNLKANAGATMVGTSSGKTVQESLDIISGTTVIYADDFPDILAACESLRSVGGGIVKLANKRYFAGECDGSTKYMGVDNISLIGAKMPSWNADASELVGGTVIEGKFNVGAHNFSVSDMGFDIGLNVVSRRWPGADTTADYVYGGTWDGFAIGQLSQTNPSPPWRNFNARNIIGLLEKSITVGHDVLIENVDGGNISNATGMYGVHGIVIKSQNITFDNLKAYMNSVDGVIFKSDAYALGGNIQGCNITSERKPPNCTPHSNPTVCEYGVYFNPETANTSGPIQVSNIRVRGSKYSVMCANADSGKIGADIQLSNLDLDGIDGYDSNSTEWGIFSANFGAFPRMAISNLNIKNTKNGALLRYVDASSSGNAQTTIDSIKLTEISETGILVEDEARVHIGSVEMYGVKNAYYLGNNAIFSVGKERLVGVTNKWGNSPWLPGAGWGPLETGNSTLDVVFSGGRVFLKGLIQAETGVTGVIMTLPNYLRPKENQRFVAFLYTGGAGTSCMIGVSAAGIVAINDGIAPAIGSYISLDGISWEIQKP